MKKLLLSLTIAVLSLGAVVADADAKRLGGGGSIGMQRSTPAHSTPTAVPAQRAPTAAPAPTATPPAVAPRRSWMGPIAGLAPGSALPRS